MTQSTLSQGTLSQRLDANENIFFQRQLEYIKAQTYDIKYPALKARELFPVSYEAGPAAKTITYRQFDQVGMAKIIANYSRDFNRVDITGKEFTANVRSLGASYAYNFQEIRSATLTGMNLQQSRANAARRAILQLENQIALQGDADNNLSGFLTNPNITTTAVANDGDGSSTLWADKDADQIIRDMNALVNGVVAITKGVETPNILLLPISQYTFISATPRSSTNDTTILQYFLNNNPFIQVVDWLNELSGAGSGGTDVMVCYDRNPDKLTLEIPSDFEQFPPQEQGLEFVIHCHERIGGVTIYYPLSVAVGEGI